MAMFPIIESDIENYLNENLMDIIKKIESVYEVDNSLYESIKILPCMNKDIQKTDSDGYPSFNLIALGRYISMDEPIKINLEKLRKKISDLEKIVKRPHVYLLCDLVLIHEFMHAYQDIIEKKVMPRDIPKDMPKDKLREYKRILDEDANAKTLKVFCEAYTEPVEIRKQVFNFFLQDSDCKLPDGQNFMLAFDMSTR